MSMENCLDSSYGRNLHNNNKSSAKLTRDNGHRSTYVTQLLPCEVFDQAADQGAFSHLGGPNDNNNNWWWLQWRPVYKWDVMLFGLYVLGPEKEMYPGRS